MRAHALSAVMTSCLLVATGALHADPITDIPYVEPEDPKVEEPHHWLDLHLPETLVPGTPTVLFIHGGGWYSGDKLDMLELLTPVKEAGYATVSCNYTLSTTTTPSYPQAIHDVKAVVHWIRTTGLDYGLSPTIIVSGPSAGGHLTEILATTSGVDIFEPVTPPDGGYRIQAGIPFFGLCSFPLQVDSGGQTGPFTWFLGGEFDGNEATYVEASPINWLDADDAPMSLAHGTGDTTHFIEQAEVMDAALNAIGVYCYLDEYAGWHSFPSYSWTDPDGITHNGFEGASIMLLEQIPVLLRAGRSADGDQDGDVDANDLLAVLADWGTCPDLPVDCPADSDGDGVVGVDDLLAVVGAWDS